MCMQFFVRKIIDTYMATTVSKNISQEYYIEEEMDLPRDIYASTYTGHAPDQVNQVRLLSSLIPNLSLA